MVHFLFITTNLVTSNDCSLNGFFSLKSSSSIFYRLCSHPISHRCCWKNYTAVTWVEITDVVPEIFHDIFNLELIFCTFEVVTYIWTNNLFDVTDKCDLQEKWPDNGDWTCSLGNLTNVSWETPLVLVCGQLFAPSSQTSSTDAWILKMIKFR